MILNSGEGWPYVLSAWEIAPVNEEGVSFDAALAQREGIPVWRLDLPADSALAGKQLRQAENQLPVLEDALASASDRIEAIVRRSQAASRGGLSFGSSALGRPEAELLGLLSSEVSYGLSLEWENAREQFQSAMTNLLQMVAHFAWVETQFQGRLVGRTVVGWSGDLNTLWMETVTPDQVELHRRSLAVAIASRGLRLRMFFTTVQGAAKLAALLTTPGGAVLALPAAWKFVNQVLGEFK